MLVLAGGSVYGLGAADGVTAALGARGRGYRMRDDAPPAPIVAGAILFDLIKSPELQTRFRWEQGAALIWDNRLVQHRGVGDFGGQTRLLHRAVVA